KKNADSKVSRVLDRRGALIVPAARIALLRPPSRGRAPLHVESVHFGRQQLLPEGHSHRDRVLTREQEAEAARSLHGRKEIVERQSTWDAGRRVQLGRVPVGGDQAQALLDRAVVPLVEAVYPAGEAVL